MILADDGQTYAFTRGISRRLEMLAKGDRVSFEQGAADPSERDDRLPVAVAIEAEW